MWSSGNHLFWGANVKWISGFCFLVVCLCLLHIIFRQPSLLVCKRGGLYFAHILPFIALPMLEVPKISVGLYALPPLVAMVLVGLFLLISFVYALFLKTKLHMVQREKEFVFHFLRYTGIKCTRVIAKKKKKERIL